MRKLIEKIKQHKGVSLLAAVGIICTIFIITSIKPDSLPTQNTPTPTPPNNLVLTSYYPPLNSTSEIAFPQTALVFQFDKEISPLTFTISIEPKIDVKQYVTQDKKTLYITPTTNWPLDTVLIVKLIESNGKVFFENKIKFTLPNEEFNPYKDKSI